MKVESKIYEILQQIRIFSQYHDEMSFLKWIFLVSHFDKHHLCKSGRQTEQI